MKNNVKKFVLKLTDLNDSQKEFLSQFKQKVYKPELLFTDESVVDSINKHPMILWKLLNHQ